MSKGSSGEGDESSVLKSATGISGYIGSFMDFVHSKGSLPGQKIPTTADNPVTIDGTSQSSCDTTSIKSDSPLPSIDATAATGKSVPSRNVARRGRGTAWRRRGSGRGVSRGRGSSSEKSNIRKRSVFDSDENDTGSETVIDDEEDADDSNSALEPPAVPRRIRSERKAKLKASLLTGRGRGKRRHSSAQSDSDSELSLTEEDSEDEVVDPDVDEDGKGYDSDKDPAWRPSKKVRQSSKKRKSGGRSSDSEEERPCRGGGVSRSRGGRGLYRGGRGGRGGSGDNMPVLVREVPIPQIVEPATAAAPPAAPAPPAAAERIGTVTPIRRARGRPFSYGNRFVGNSPVPITTVMAQPAVTAPRTLPDVIPQCSVIPVAVANPNDSKESSATAISMPAIFFADVFPPHNFQKGEFVFDRRDAQNYTAYPIWKIDSQRLLQKFEAFEQDGRLLHRSMCTYSSWPAHTQHNFMGVAIRYLSSTRGKEVLEVQPKYRPRPLGVRGVELETLREAFVIYTQTLVSQALEPTFISALLQEPDEYYIDPMTKVDSLMNVRKLSVQGIFNWSEEFLEVLTKFPCYIVSDIEDDKQVESRATTGETALAKKYIRLFGHVYNCNTLQCVDEVTEDNAQQFALSKAELLCVSILHALHHFKFNLCQSCLLQIEALKADRPNIDDHDVLDHCLRNQPWMQQVFLQLTTLLENADRITDRQS